jgi:hypothetical protein
VRTYWLAGPGRHLDPKDPLATQQLNDRVDEINNVMRPVPMQELLELVKGTRSTNTR